MKADVLIITAGSNTQTIMTRMCRFHRGLRVFRANHNIIRAPVRSCKLRSVEGLKHQRWRFNINWLRDLKDE